MATVVGVSKMPKTQYTKWLSAKTPSDKPYFPQIGDEVVYFREGHEYYVEHVLRNHIYDIDQKQLPWNVDPNLSPVIPARVIGLTYRNRAPLKPPALAVLQLQIGHWGSGNLTPKYIKEVAYHHSENLPDFIVLRQVFNQSVDSSWRGGDRFRKWADKEWWLGTVLTVKPFNEKFPNSKFLSLLIKYDHQRIGAETFASPWDIEEIPDVLEIPSGSGCCDGILPATEFEIRAHAYQPGPREWLPHGQEAECDRIARLLSVIMTRGLAPAFGSPVDLNQYPAYLLSIPYPVDLSTIKARLENRFYRRKAALEFDLKFIAINAEIFNLPTTDIVKRARVITELCLRTSRNPELLDMEAEYFNIFNNFVPGPNVEKLTPEVIYFPLNGIEVKEEVVLIPATTADASITDENPGPSHRVNPPVGHTPAGNPASGNNESNKSWKQRCLKILDTLWDSNNSVPFRAPVDILKVPNYYQVIDLPMDLQTVREDLIGDNYKSATEFARDIRLIISNSKMFNKGKHSKVYKITLRFEDEFEELIQTVIPGGRNSRQLRNEKSRAQALRDKYLSASPGSSTSGLTNGNTKRRKRSFARANRQSEQEAADSVSEAAASSSNELIGVQRNIALYLQGINETQKEILRLKKLKYADLGLI